MEAKKPQPPTLGERFLMEQGREIEMRARGLYPGGLTIEDSDPELAQKNTITAIKNRKVSAIFNATFSVDSFVTKADIIQRVKGGWRLGEVKSGVLDKPEYIDDMAYTTMIAENAGFKCSETSLILVSKDFRLGMDNERLFAEKDHTEEVRDKVELFKTYSETVEQITRAPKKPDPKLKSVCKDCDLFGDCLGSSIKNPIIEIPRLSGKKCDELVGRGINKIEDIPDNFGLTQRQDVVRQSVKNNTPIVSGDLKIRLESLTWPLYYLDFETVSTAIPLYPDVAPYDQVPTQHSVHKCSRPGQALEHYEFLADPSRECRKEFVKSLIATLGNCGSIIVYGPFEKSILTKLKDTFPALSSQIDALIDRIVNLQQIVSANFYHPNFHGSTGIKTILPVLVPETGYETLKIKEGDSANAAFAYLALGRFKGTDGEEIKKSLREYCAQDTLALYKIQQRLIQICSSETQEQFTNHQTSLGEF